MNRRSFFSRLAAVAALPFVGKPAFRPEEYTAIIAEPEVVWHIPKHWADQMPGLVTINEYRRSQGQPPA